MIGAPNTRGQKYWVGIVQWAAETSVSEEIADILTNYDIDYDAIQWIHFPCCWFFVRGIQLSPAKPMTYADYRQVSII